MHAARFAALGTQCEVLCTSDVAATAEAIAREHLDAVDRACSRFRADSEVRRLAAAAESRPGYALASATLLNYLDAALHAARLTDGLVDLTVGAAVVASGYDDDIEVVRARRGFAATQSQIPGWRTVVVHDIGLIGTPAGCLLDFGSSAKAHAADRIAAQLTDRLPGGFLVNLGGDIATSGPVPEGGWRITLSDATDAELQVVALHGQALATSSTRHRTWVAGDGFSHHIVDPRSGTTSSPLWAQVSVCAGTALDANAASTAAIVLGLDAPVWLERRGFAARLDADGDTVFTGGWPQQNATDSRAA